MLYRKLFAHFYDRAMRRVEHLCLQRWRADLLAELQGTLLEIGAGTGANLPYYRSTVERLVLCEPDPAMRKQLEAAAGGLVLPSIEIRSCAAEQLDQESGSIDHLVSTLVLCSVSDLRQALCEAYRVLRPGGSLILMEHVAAADKQLYSWQRFWQPVWKPLACNCHLTRQTATMLKDAGFLLEIRREVMRGAPAVAAPMIIGRALRP